MNLHDTIDTRIKKALSEQLDNILSVVSDVEVALAKADERLRKVEAFLGSDLKNSVLTAEQVELANSIRAANEQTVSVTQTKMKVAIPKKK